MGNELIKMFEDIMNNNIINNIEAFNNFVTDFIKYMNSTHGIKLMTHTMPWILTVLVTSFTLYIIVRTNKEKEEEIEQ